MARWTADAMAEQDGRIALVTGANTGIGFEAALQLARKGAHVLLGCRDQQRAKQAIERIQAAAPTASLEWLPLDWRISPRWRPLPPSCARAISSSIY